MTELLLGLRLLLGSGRGNRVRFFLMSVGSAVGVCCLAAVLAIPGVLAAQDARVAHRQPTCDLDTQARCIHGEGAPLELTMTDPLGARPMTRVFLAPGTRRVGPPPGLQEFPAEGEVFLSPRLHDALRDNPHLGQLLPGREKGLVGAQGLARPDELLAYVGVSRDRLRDGGPITRFGMPYPPDPTVESSTLDIVRFTLAGVVLLPLVVFLSVCARLSAASRARRLAALRLLGMSKKGVQRVNAAETVAAAFIGAVLGLCAYWLLNQLVSRVGLPGFTWYPSDGSLSPAIALLCLIGCPSLAWFVGRASARKAAANPLAVRRTAVEKPPGKWGLLPLVPGLGIVAGYCVAGATGHAPRDTAVSSVLMPIAVVLVGAGLVLALPLLSRFLARRMAHSSRSLTLGIAMRRNEVEPGGALRVATGLVLLVYAASLVQGVLIELDQVSKHNSPVQIYNIMLDGLPLEDQAGLEKVTDVRVHAAQMTSTDAVGDHHGNRIDALVATCGQLRTLVPRVDRCRDNRVARLRQADAGTDDTFSRPGETYSFEVRKKADKRFVQVTVPQDAIRYSDWPDIGAVDAEILVPPSLLPAGYRPVNGNLTLLSDSEPATVRTVLDSIGGVDPTINVDPFGINVSALQQIAIVKTLLGSVAKVDLGRG